MLDTLYEKSLLGRRLFGDGGGGLRAPLAGGGEQAKHERRGHSERVARLGREACVARAVLRASESAYCTRHRDRDRES